MSSLLGVPYSSPPPPVGVTVEICSRSEKFSPLSMRNNPSSAKSSRKDWKTSLAIASRPFPFPVLRSALCL